NDSRMIQNPERSRCQEDSQLGWTDFQEREPKHRVDMCRQKKLGFYHQEQNENAQCNERIHVTRESEPTEQEKGSDNVNDVINIESVTRPLLVTHPGKCSVQTIAKPVQGQCNDHQYERRRIFASAPVTQARQ